MAADGKPRRTCARSGEFCFIVAPLGWRRVGVAADAPWIHDVIRHEQTGLLVDPARGVIYGRLGNSVGWECADGYVRLGARPYHQYAHRLIWETVHGPIPAGLQIDHLNGQKADNRVCNLEAVTRSENVARAIAKGLAPIGEDRAQSKLTEANVRDIRRSIGKVATREWARRLGVDPAVVRAVRKGKTWRHVPMRGRTPALARTTRRNRRRT